MGATEDPTTVIDVDAKHDSGLDAKEKDTLLALLTDAGQTLQESSEENEVKEALDSISMKCSERREIQEATFEAVLHASLPPIILNTITKWSSTEHVVAQALTTIHNTSLDEDIAQWYVTKCNAFPILIKYMVQYPTNFHIQTRGAGAIGMFMKMNDSTVIVPYIKDLCVIQVLIDSLQNHPDYAKLHRWVLKALMIITTLFIDEYKQDCIDLNLVGTVGKTFDKHRQNNEYGVDITKFSWSILRSLMPPIGDE